MSNMEQKKASTRGSFQTRHRLTRNSQSASTHVRFSRIPRSSMDAKQEMPCYSKLEKMYSNSHALDNSQNIPHNIKLLKNMLKRLESRGQSFYKFGFRSFEKSINMSVLQDILNLKPNQVAGTMSVCDLWTGKNIVQYLKSNQMFLNKKQLMIELKLLEKEQARNLREACKLSTSSASQREKKDTTVYRTPKSTLSSSMDIQQTNFQLFRIVQKLGKLNAESINMINKDASFQKLQAARDDLVRLGKVYENRMVEI